MLALKRALRSTAAQAVAGWAIATYVKAIRPLGRFTIENGAVIDDLLDRGRPFILCYWHSRILMFQYLWRYPTRMNLLISQHRDGKVIARAAGYFGLATIAGSSTRGGSQALRAMVRALKAGECVAVTPDGPRGPRMRVSPGAIHTARIAGVPLVPVAFSASRRKVLGSWDRFIVPLPFTDFRARIGEPVAIPADADETAIEAACLTLEQRLNQMTQDIETAWGLKPVEPDPPAARVAPAEAASRG